MAYIQVSDITNKIDAVNLQASLDDYAQGPSNTTISSQILTTLLQQASDAADGYVASIYITPFTSYIPKQIKNAAISFCCEMIYQRRLVPDEKNPFKSEADYWRERLIEIGKGNAPLDAQVKRAFGPIVAQISHTRMDTNMF